jgi:hypothetical protein
LHFAGGEVGFPHRSEQRDDNHQPNDTMNAHHPIAASAFSKSTLRNLAKAGLFIVSATFIPGSDGSYANGESAYVLSNGQMKSYLEVLKLA